MGYHPRIEGKNLLSFQTTRTIRSELWFIGSHELENAILGYLAKYKKRYGAEVYAFAIEGNHIQFPACFPNANRAHFMRDLNSSTARAVPRYHKHFKGGKVFGRRYAGDYIPWDDDLLETFFYTVLQPVQDGLVDHIREYQGYNCFEDAINERERTFCVVDWKRYNAALARNKVTVPDINKYTEKITLKYDRLPQFKDMPKEEYIKMMREQLEARIKEIVANRKINDFLERLEVKIVEAMRRKEWEKYTRPKQVLAVVDNNGALTPVSQFETSPTPEHKDKLIVAKPYSAETQQIVIKVDDEQIVLNMADLVKDYRKVWKEKKPGDEPFFTKTSTIDSHRPRILSKDPERRRKGLDWYFAVYKAYKEASLEYRAGKLDTEFPQGTYRPPMFTVAIESVQIMLM